MVLQAEASSEMGFEGLGASQAVEGMITALGEFVAYVGID